MAARGGRIGVSIAAEGWRICLGNAQEARKRASGTPGRPQGLLRRVRCVSATRQARSSPDWRVMPVNAVAKNSGERRTCVWDRKEPLSPPPAPSWPGGLAWGISRLHIGNKSARPWRVPWPPPRPDLADVLRAMASTWPAETPSARPAGACGPPSSATRALRRSRHQRVCGIPRRVRMSIRSICMFSIMAP